MPISHHMGLKFMKESCERVLHCKDHYVKEQSRESSDKEEISKNLETGFILNPLLPKYSFCSKKNNCLCPKQRQETCEVLHRKNTVLQQVQSTAKKIDRSFVIVVREIMVVGSHYHRSECLCTESKRKKNNSVKDCRSGE